MKSTTLNLRKESPTIQNVSEEADITRTLQMIRVEYKHDFRAFLDDMKAADRVAKKTVDNGRLCRL